MSETINSNSYTAQPEDQSRILDSAATAAEFTLGITDDEKVKRSASQLGEKMLLATGVYDQTKEGQLELSRVGVARASMNVPWTLTKAGGEFVKNAPNLAGNIGNAALRSIVQLSEGANTAPTGLEAPPASTFSPSEFSNPTAGAVPEQVTFTTEPNPAQAPPMELPRP